MCQYMDANCGRFEAMTQHGYLHATVKNKGYIASMFHVSVTDCTEGILPMEGQVSAHATVLPHM